MYYTHDSAVAKQNWYHFLHFCLSVTIEIRNYTLVHAHSHWYTWWAQHISIYIELGSIPNECVYTHFLASVLVYNHEISHSVLIDKNSEQLNHAVDTAYSWVQNPMWRFVYSFLTFLPLLLWETTQCTRSLSFLFRLAISNNISGGNRGCPKSSRSLYLQILTLHNAILHYGNYRDSKLPLLLRDLEDVQIPAGTKICD